MKPKIKTNWAKLIGLTLANSAVAAIGGTTVGESFGIIANNPKNAMKLAIVGALLGGGNLLVSVTKEKLDEKFGEDSEAEETSK